VDSVAAEGRFGTRYVGDDRDGTCDVCGDVDG